MNEREIMEKAIEWGKRNYPYLIENREVLVKMYKRQVMGEEVSTSYRRRIPFKLLTEVDDKKSRVMATIIEIRKSGVKNVKWYRVIMADKSTDVYATIFIDKDSEEELKEGETYIFDVYKKSDGIVGNYVKALGKEEALSIDAIHEYLFGINNGMANKEKFLHFIRKKAVDYEDVKEIFSLVEEGENVRAWR